MSESIPYLKNNKGQKLYYHCSENNADKSSPLIVFLGGFCSEMAGTKAMMFEKYCQANHHNYLRLDYSGHGISEGEFLDGCISDWANDAKDVIVAVSQQRPVVLIGSSMGGWIMLLVALQLGSQVKGILGIASAPDFTEKLVWAQMSEEDKLTIQQHGKLAISEPIEDMEPLYITQKMIDDGRRHLLLDNDINITVPMILIHGLIDIEVPWDVSLQLMQAVKSSHVEIRLIKDGDHRLSTDAHLKDLQRGLYDLLQRL